MNVKRATHFPPLVNTDAPCPCASASTIPSRSSSGRTMPCSTNASGRSIKTTSLFRSAWIPASISLIFLTSEAVMFCSSAYSRRASAYGWDERASIPAARAIEASFRRPLAMITAPIDGFPEVSVPVLSNRTWLTLERRSRTFPPRAIAPM